MCTVLCIKHNIVHCKILIRGDLLFAYTVDRADAIITLQLLIICEQDKQKPPVMHVPMMMSSCNERDSKEIFLCAVKQILLLVSKSR